MRFGAPVGSAMLAVAVDPSPDCWPWRRRRGIAVDPRELQLARQLIESLSADWKPGQYRDTYADAIRRVIEQKVEGQEIATPELK